MPNIIMYSKKICPYCVKAKGLFKSKGVSFTEISIEGDDEKRDEMLKKANGAMTVPQIFIDDFHVGGCDDLFELDRNNKLDELIRK